MGGGGGGGGGGGAKAKIKIEQGKQKKKLERHSARLLVDIVISKDYMRLRSCSRPGDLYCMLIYSCGSSWPRCCFHHNILLKTNV